MSKATLPNSAVEVEAEAVLEGLILAKEKNCQEIILESDSMDVVSCMRDENLHLGDQETLFMVHLGQMGMGISPSKSSCACCCSSVKHEGTIFALGLTVSSLFGSVSISWEVSLASL
ncbi:unnamed protein product [Prunus brigantina]